MVQFTFEMVINQNVGGNSSLAVDPQGNPHIMYREPGGLIQYAHKSTGQWIFEQLPTGTMMDPASDTPICLAISSKGQPNIVFQNKDDGGVFFGVKANDWVFTRIPLPASSEAKGGRDFSLALDPSRDSRDTPHVSFHDLFHAALVHSARTDANWASTKLEPLTVVAESGFTTSVTVDPSGNLTIFYCVKLSTGASPIPFQLLLHAASPQVQLEGLPEKWVTTAIDNNATLIKRVSCTSTFGNLFVAYYDQTSRTLKGRLTGLDLPEPQFETIATGVDIAHLSAGAHIDLFFVAYDDGQLKLASRSRLGDWTTQVVDPAGGAWASLAIDAAGTAHIAYQVGGTLKHATGSI